MKKKVLRASTYREATIEIPYERLRTILKKGDIIYGHPGVHASSSSTAYIVTHIDWWGVFAIPTKEMLEEYAYRIKDVKKHYKFKWNGITGVLFQ